jgi:toxin CcdB
VQFCAFRLPTGQLVLDMQADVLSHLKSRLVAPLAPESAGEKAMTILEPVLEMEGERLVLLTTEMVTIPASLIAGPPVARFTDADHTTRRALDMLFSGF